MWDFLKAFQKVQQLAEEIEKVRIVGTSSDGSVRITLSGHQTMLSVEIDPDLLSQKDKLEAAIIEAFHDARDKLQQLIMEKLGGSSPLPFLPGNIGLG